MILCIVAGIKIIASFESRDKITEDIESAFLSVTEQQRLDWQKKYPSGYKIVLIRGNKIVHTSQDTLPQDLKIDWHNVGVTVIPANSLTRTEEKIRIDLPISSYAPVDVYGRDVSAELSRHQRKALGLTKLGWHNLMIEIIGEEDDDLLCLIGFQ